MQGAVHPGKRPCSGALDPSPPTPPDSPPPPGHPRTPGPHTANSHSTSTNTGSRGGGRGWPGWQHQGPTSRAAGPPPPARRAGDRGCLVSQPGSRPSHLPRASQPQPSRTPRSSRCPHSLPCPLPQGAEAGGGGGTPVSQPHVGWAWVGGGGRLGSVVPAPGPSPQPGGLGREAEVLTENLRLQPLPGPWEGSRKSLCLLCGPAGPAPPPPTSGPLCPGSFPPESYTRVGGVQGQ